MSKVFEHAVKGGGALTLATLDRAYRYFKSDAYHQHLRREAIADMHMVCCVTQTRCPRCHRVPKSGLTRSQP